MSKNKAREAGGLEEIEPQDYGWMYGRSFEGIDGHIWAIFHMDESDIIKVIGTQIEFI
ncbi:hypothetical protein [Methanococcoides sp. AM1]|uniref:hypothetical protein n=1 Tax=Methanococcoides sp. AM1 TaxID=1201011 RepID=UPI001AF01F22|nr:hypothetical protein [Methanococcoides sp. AM1]